MSLYVLDTDMLTLFAQGQHAVARRVREQPAARLASGAVKQQNKAGGDGQEGHHVTTVVEADPQKRCGEDAV